MASDSVRIPIDRVDTNTIHVVECPQGHIDTYVARSKSKRPRKVCKKCQKKYDLTRWKLVRSCATVKEVAMVIGQLNRKDHQVIDGHTDRRRELGLELENTLLNSTHGTSPSKGHRDTPYDHGDHVPNLRRAAIRVPAELEVDFLHVTAVLSPEVWSKLALDPNYASNDFEPIEIKEADQTFRVYPSGVVDCRIDTTRASSIQAAEGVLKWLMDLAGVESCEWKVNDHELTINAAEDSVLAGKIRKVLGERFKLALLEPSEKVKVYQSHNGPIRIESRGIPELLQAVGDFYKEHIPDLTVTERVIVIQYEDDRLPAVEEHLAREHGEILSTLNNQAMVIGGVKEELVALNASMEAVGSQVQLLLQQRSEPMVIGGVPNDHPLVTNMVQQTQILDRFSQYAADSFESIITGMNHINEQLFQLSSRLEAAKSSGITAKEQAIMDAIAVGMRLSVMDLLEALGYERQRKLRSRIWFDLQSLVKRGLLRKEQVGRIVYYSRTEHEVN